MIDENIHEQRAFDRVLKIASRVAKMARLSLGWIAAQNGGGYAFVIGEKVPFVSDDDLATKTDDEIVNDCFVQVYGYAPDSRQDKERKLQITLELISKYHTEMDKMAANTRSKIKFAEQLAAELREMTG